MHTPMARQRLTAHIRIQAMQHCRLRLEVFSWSDQEGQDAWPLPQSVMLGKLHFDLASVSHLHKTLAVACTWTARFNATAGTISLQPSPCIDEHTTAVV